MEKSILQNDFEGKIEIQLIAQYFNNSSRKTTIINQENGLRIKQNDFFLIDALIRVVVRNPTTLKDHSKYPVLINCNFKLGGISNQSVNYLEIFPRTLNSDIESSITDDEGINTNNNHSYSSGSSNSQSNSFGVNIGYSAVQGFSAGADYRFTLENSYNNSNTISSDTGYRLGQAVQVSMSIKDWGSIGIINQSRSEINWKWGQSYPWDALTYTATDNKNFILLPKYMTRRLLLDNKNTLAPPSNLAKYGIDFLMTSKSKIALYENNKDNSFINSRFELEVFQAQNEVSTSSDKSECKVKINPNPKKLVIDNSDKIDLYKLSLNHLSEKNSFRFCNIFFDTDSYINFINDSFRINSTSNNLLVDGTGFIFDKEKGLIIKDTKASISVYFKIIDNTMNYDLVLMHWIETYSCEVNLSICINGFYVSNLTVDFMKDKGGHDNKSVISLRNVDFNSVNFHDYLVLGLNEIKIEIKGSKANEKYKLFGISIV